jgi:hypothetical protein
MGWSSPFRKGKYSAYRSPWDGVWSIYVMNADGSGERKVMEVPDSYTNSRYGVDRDWADEQITWEP